MAERVGMDPTDLWRQWYEAGSRMWTGAMPVGSEMYTDPWGLYRQWFEGMESLREQAMQGMNSFGANFFGGSANSGAAASAWQKGVDTAMESWRKSAESTTEMMSMTPRWMEMLDQARENMMSVREYPKDPLEFAVQWYNATSGPYSEFVQDVIEREEFLEQGSKFLQSYASFYKVFKRSSEEYLHNAQIPTRSDITRVASLVVALEEKVDRIEEAVEDSEYTSASARETPVLDQKIEAVEKRLDGVESKLDRLLAALEGGAGNTPQDSVSGSNGAGIKATDAARRKARDMDVDLAEIDGTGADGQITIEDVRKKGDA